MTYNAPIMRVPRCPKCGALMHRSDDGQTFECSNGHGEIK